jgi:hypothetical protein
MQETHLTAAGRHGSCWAQAWRAGRVKPAWSTWSRHVWHVHLRFSQASCAVSGTADERSRKAALSPGTGKAGLDRNKKFVSRQPFLEFVMANGRNYSRVRRHCVWYSYSAQSGWSMLVNPTSFCNQAKGPHIHSIGACCMLQPSVWQPAACAA